MYFKANPRSCAISPLHILVNISESRAILCHCSSIIKLLEVTGLLAVTCTWYRRGLLAASRSFMDPVVFIHVQPETHHSFDCVWLMSFLVKKVSILPLPPYCFPPKSLTWWRNRVSFYAECPAGTLVCFLPQGTITPITWFLIFPENWTVMTKVQLNPGV